MAYPRGEYTTELARATRRSFPIVIRLTLPALCLAYCRLSTMSVWHSSATQQVQAMSTNYDHRDWRISHDDVTAMWIIAAVIFVTILVLSLLVT